MGNCKRAFPWRGIDKKTDTTEKIENNIGKNIKNTEVYHRRKIEKIGERKQTSAVEVDEGKGTKGTKKKATTRRKTAKQPAVKGLGINSK